MGRRNAGDGSLYQRKDGSWVAQFKGKYKYSKDKDKAKEKLHKMLSGAEEVKPSNITVGTVLDQYLGTATVNLKPRTITRYRVAIQVHLKPSFGTTRLHKLTALQVEEVYARKLKDGLSASTIQLINAILSSAIKRAVRLKLTEHNICKDVQTPKIHRDEVTVFSPDEVRAILEAAGSRAMWLLALQTGLRVGELLGLKASDFDAEKGTLSIRRTVHNGLVGSPKSVRGKRTITLPQRAYGALRGHTEGMLEDSWMFPSRRGNPISFSSFIACYYKPLLKQAGVEYKNFHTCRHYVASTLPSRGLPIPAVARFMGHTEETLLKTYSHLMPDQMDAVAAAMDETLG
jgi:integrase